jgi:hypothetical protein
MLGRTIDGVLRVPFAGVVTRIIARLALGCKLRRGADRAPTAKENKRGCRSRQ